MLLNFKLKTFEIGVALSLLGVPVGMYLNYFSGNNTFFSNLVMIASLALIINYKNLLKFNFYKIGSYYLYISVFQFFCVLYAFYAGIFEYIGMHFYIMALILSLSTNSLSEFDIKKSILFIFIISSTCSLLGAYFLYNNLLVGKEVWELKQNEENYALEVFTVAYCSVINFSCCLYYINEKKYQFISYILIFFNFYVIVGGGKRSPFIVAILIYFTWLYFSRSINKIKSILVLFLILFVFTILSLFDKDYSSAFNQITENTMLGIQAFLGNTTVFDQTGSASYRVGLRDWAYDLLNNRFSILNYFFGYGYMTRWLDNPILQSYIDMGFFGILSYFIIVIFFPIFYAIKNRHSKEIILFFTFCLYAIITCISSGNPYLYIKYLPVIIFLYIYSVYYKIKKDIS